MMSRALRMRSSLSRWGCVQRGEFLLEQALRRGELENLAGDAVEMFDVHLEVERVDIT